MLRKRDNKGFTLIELLVAVGILAILISVATPYVLKRIDEARVASLNETIVNIKTALHSCMVRYSDFNDGGDGDYLDDLMTKGCLTSFSPIPQCTQWYLRKTNDGNGHNAYVLEIEYDSCPSKVLNYFKMLDEGFDDGATRQGNIRIYGNY